VVKGSNDLYLALQDAAGEYGVAVNVRGVGCVGMCHRTPLVEVVMPHVQPVLYECVTADDAERIVDRHFKPRGIKRLRIAARHMLDQLLDDSPPPAESRAINVRDPAVSAFLGPQHHIATELFGTLEPGDVDAYIAGEGFGGLTIAQSMQAEQLLDAIEASGLRGRGGAGFPAATKWRALRRATDDTKYIVCNGDEGDPGAFMDRMLLESFPFRVIEGLAIAACATGAKRGVFYIRHEYPLAVRRVREAIAVCEALGLLGDDLTLSVFEGAGAFVCGEETALISSMEGQRGMPRRRPPYPVQHGLFGKPTLVNNVETLALVPWIVRHGPRKFAELGTAHSKGTKVFALAGKVKRGGLIEVPMGVTIRQIVDEIGGGVANDRHFKAVQIGGPSGGCIPASLADTPVDYEALRGIGAIMGSGGLVVLDDTDCMVDLARYFLRFTQEQSCGKCTFCRIGTRRMLDILDRICAGDGRPSDLETLEHLAHQVKAGSLCGLGATAPNPVLTTLRYFRDEYEAHLAGRCPAGKCKSLIHYRVNDQCVGCTICAQHCPADAIPMTPYRPHTIDDAACTRCDTCRIICPHNAIEVR
jgi:NADH-quinone oxidoreductase subunit F